jgi:hypothetical protein
LEGIFTERLLEDFPGLPPTIKVELKVSLLNTQDIARSVEFQLSGSQLGIGNPDSRTTPDGEQGSIVSLCVESDPFGKREAIGTGPRDA